MTKRYPLAHRIQQPAKPYRASYDTNIAATIKAERKRLAEADAVKTVRVAPLIVDVIDGVNHIVPNERVRRVK